MIRSFCQLLELAFSFRTTYSRPRHGGKLKCFPRKLQRLTDLDFLPVELGHARILP